MKPVYQTRFGDGSDGAPPGNCVAACYASLFEAPLEEIPDFAGAKHQSMAEEDWLATLGLGFVSIDVDARPQPYLPPEAHYMMAGISPRGVGHRVVARCGEVVHDPHPAGGGLVTVQRHVYLVVLDPGPRNLARTSAQAPHTSPSADPVQDAHRFDLIAITKNLTRPNQHCGFNTEAGRDAWAAVVTAGAACSVCARPFHEADDDHGMSDRCECGIHHVGCCPTEPAERVADPVEEHRAEGEDPRLGVFERLECGCQLTSQGVIRCATHAKP